MERISKLGVAGAGLALLMGVRVASAEVALEPQVIPVGSFVFMPTLKSYVGYDDNVYNFSSSELGSYYVGVAPSFSLIARDRNNSYRLSYDLDGRTYAYKSDDSYLDHSLSLDAHVEPNSRLRLDGGLGYRMSHDARGTGRSSGYTQAQLLGTSTAVGMGEVDKFDVLGLSAGFEYGAEDARGMIVGKVGRFAKGYDRSLVAAIRDNDQTSAELGLRLRMMSRTKMTFDIERVETDYDGAGVLDTEDNRYYAGLAWENTAQTTGKLRLGQSKRSVTGGSDISKFSWDAGVVWSPRDRDTLVASTGRKTGDSSSDSDSVFTTSYSLSWKHQWLDRLNTEAGFIALTDDIEYKQAGVTKVREDKSRTVSVGANYQMRRWLVLHSGIELRTRNSSESAYDADRNVYTVGALLSL